MIIPDKQLLQVYIYSANKNKRYITNWNTEKGISVLSKMNFDLWFRRSLLNFPSKISMLLASRRATMLLTGYFRIACSWDYPDITSILRDFPLLLVGATLVKKEPFFVNFGCSQCSLETIQVPVKVPLFTSLISLHLSSFLIDIGRNSFQCQWITSEKDCRWCQQGLKYP